MTVTVQMRQGVTVKFMHNSSNQVYVAHYVRVTLKCRLLKAILDNTSRKCLNIRFVETQDNYLLR